jgi:flagellar biosynthesis regulator FlaF
MAWFIIAVKLLLKNTVPKHEFNGRNSWSLFQAELTKPDHPMDKELRQNLLNLSNHQH